MQTEPLSHATVLAGVNARSAPSQPSRLEEFFIVAILFVFCALPFLLSDQPRSLISVQEMGIGAPQGDSAKQLILVAMYVLTAIVLLPRLNAAIWKAIGVPLLLLILWVFASIAWSDLPAVTLRRAVAVSGTLIVGVYIAARWSMPRFVDLFNTLAVLILGASLLVALVLPASGLDSEARLRGVFAHKNSLASFAAISLLCAASSLFRHGARSREGRVAWIVVLLGGVGLISARSASPIPATAMALIVAYYAARSSSGHRHRLTIVTCAILALWVLLLPWIAEEVGEVATWFGRSTDFSGRTSIWTFSREFIERRPILGFGYASFWNGPAGMLFYRWAHFPVPHAHNGALQFLIDCGAIGLGLFIVLMVVSLNRLHQALNSSFRAQMSWIAGYLVLYLFANLTETNLFESNNLYTVLFASAVIRINMAFAALAQKDAGQANRAFKPANAGIS